TRRDARLPQLGRDRPGRCRRCRQPRAAGGGEGGGASDARSLRPHRGAAGRRRRAGRRPCPPGPLRRRHAGALRPGRRAAPPVRSHCLARPCRVGDRPAVRDPHRTRDRRHPPHYQPPPVPRRRLRLERHARSVCRRRPLTPSGGCPVIDATALTTDARRLALEVEDDLRAVLAASGELSQQWRDKHTAALRGNRTSADFATWRDENITQVAVSWVLTTVFVRFLEDNDLISPRWFAGHGSRRTEATDAEQAYFRAHPAHTSREWILRSIEHLAGMPATAQLVDAKAMLHQIPISGRMAEQIIAFWRATDDDGALVRDFTDPDLGT